MSRDPVDQLLHPERKPAHERMSGPIATRRISPEQKQQVIRWRAHGLIQRECALRAGISERATRDILKAPGAEEEVARLREQLGPPDMIDLLRQIANDPAEKTADRIQAARALLSCSLPVDAPDAPAGPPTVTVISALPE